MIIWTILSWIIIGFVVGLIARAIVPGRQALGLWKTAGLGVAGALVGGLISWMFTGGMNYSGSYNATYAWPGWLLSTLCAVILLWFAGRGSSRHIHH